MITDYTMPHMNGIDLTKRMIGIRSDIPVILCTGFGERTVHVKSRDAGVRALLIKPLEKSDVAELVRNVLDKDKG